MAQAPPQEKSLRVEHDALAQRLETRPSVDVARNGLLATVGGLLALGVSAALVLDRYDQVNPSELARAHPAQLMAGAAVAGVLGVALLVWGIGLLRRARRMARAEAVLFARLLELRRLLGIDA